MTCLRAVSHQNSAASMRCEAAASFCVSVQLDSVILTESVFLSDVILPFVGNVPS